MKRLGRRVMLGVMALATLAASTSAFALEPGKDGYYHTGSGVRVKKVVLVNVKVYEVNHYMKALPPQKSKQAVVDAACDKRFVLRMLRDVDAEKMRDALTESYGRTGADKAKLTQLLNSISTELKENSYLVFSYNADQKTTTLKVGDKSASVAGEDFMKATWKIWFGSGINDQSGLGDQLISKLPLERYSLGVRTARATRRDSPAPYELGFGASAVRDPSEHRASAAGHARRDRPRPNVGGGKRPQVPA